MTKAPRVLTRDEMEQGLRRGKVLIIDDPNAAELPELLEMERKGWVSMTTETTQDDIQILKFKWTHLEKAKLDRVINFNRHDRRKWKIFSGRIGKGSARNKGRLKWIT